jgi:hypothetical protein
MLTDEIDMSNQKFVKNTNTPPRDSPLWNVGQGWKRSEKGNDYTNLGEITNVELGAVLCDQFEAEVTQPIDHVNHFFVPSYSQNGKFLIYAFPDQNSAEKKAKWEKPVKVPEALDFREKTEEVTTRGENQNQTTMNEQLPVQQSNTAASSTVETAKPKPTGRTIEVIRDETIIKVGDIAAIGEAEQRGLYCLPIIHVGNNRLCFQSKDENDHNFYMLYGRIINVKIGDN